MAPWFLRVTPGSRPQPPASAPYDEFDPKSEWKDEPAANVLNIYLPGFVKDQIKVRFDQVTKTLSVIAERPGGNNRTIRVNKDYIIPGNSNLEDMRAKFEDQTLKITIAKEITSQVDPKLREPTKTSQEPSSTQKPRSKKSPTLPAAPSPPPHDPWREMAEGRDLLDPTVLMRKAKAEFIKDEDENETPTPPPSSTQKQRSKKSPAPPAPPPPPPPPLPPLEKQKPEEKRARIPYILPDPWHEMAEGRDFPDPIVLMKKAKAEFIKDEDENETSTPPSSSTQKQRSKKSPAPPAAPPPPPAPPPLLPLEKQKPEEKRARIPYILPDPWREMAEGRDFPDPNVLMKKAKAKFIKDEEENETPTPPGKEDRRSVTTDDEEIGGKRKKSPKAKIWVPEERKELFPDQAFGL